MKPATVRALRLLEARGADGLTDAEYHGATGFWRLAARVGEIRREIGEGAVQTVFERTGDGQGRFARYYLRPRPVAAPTTGHQLGLLDSPQDGRDTPLPAVLPGAQAPG